ncbi:TPA: XRE family transcriptional regulator [Klebsiella pneumoniae]|uniref:XRE family transcriptional regulator n=1 Tax=Klebsiella pneumoniae TaxID=573 RepID=A0A3G4RJ89_KLEPN|nr:MULTISPECIES: XRE family transcriptional regulator [Klebsiella]AYU65730.1 hypothetical protein [Klebsiella pneumoniae]MBC4425496.1 XRE family transcriptional regulator [Klebsiella variicola]MBK2797270.1 XRE family transcriptional regulator [Klebsiella pneumoniae]MCC4959740.1 type II toxin-antitoxin system MqsA family antitoxin [Klebsiella pneumoniae]MCD7091702.1 type II toxin-antitoxin system MqsA family antitoxin [Klebsiella quasipneumoniae subsp. quasipneumoniae]
MAEKSYVPPKGGEVRRLRELAGLSLKQAAEIYGITVPSWSKRESEGVSHIPLNPVEYTYLQLLADDHPELTLSKK